MNDTLNTILTTVLIPLLPVLTAFVIAYIKKKTALLEQSINHAELNKYIDIASEAVTMAVDAVSQTYVDTLKSTNAWTADTQKQAFEMAKSKALTIMGQQAQKALADAYGDVNTWLEAAIEQQVKLNK